MSLLPKKWNKKKALAAALIMICAAAVAMPGCAKRTSKKKDSRANEKTETDEKSGREDVGEEKDTPEKEEEPKKQGVPADPSRDEPVVVTVSEPQTAGGEGLPADLITAERVDGMPGGDWQMDASFPDPFGLAGSSRAMTQDAYFLGYAGQGQLYVNLSPSIASFDFYINGKKADTSGMQPGNIYRVSFPGVARNGKNTVQVSGIEPAGLSGAVRLCVPYPQVIDGKPEDAGIDSDAIDLIADIIEADVKNGFPGAQLCVIRNGRLVCSRSWGRINAYHPDGTLNKESPEATTDTLYDLASVTKMFAVNYAMQKLLTEGQIDLDSKVTDYLGSGFCDETLDFHYAKGADVGIDMQRAWKASITIRDLLRHRAGFPASPRYCNPYVDAVTQELDVYTENLLFAGNDGTEETKRATEEAICRTPLMYEPGSRTEYSDVDYMILGLIIEKKTGKSLDAYLKENFLTPMGLSHMTFRPLDHGFRREDCAATELNGNTRDGVVDYPGIRRDTIWGEVHDETAYYSMGGVSGHAGLFSNASDLARLMFVMLSGGYGNRRFFSGDVIDEFISPSQEDPAFGLGWWRQGNGARSRYFGTLASPDAFGHQGWTGTLVMCDPEKDLVVAYLTNKINTPVADKYADPNKFKGSSYTSASLGFVPQILCVGMSGGEDVKQQLQSLRDDLLK